jgi:chemotaxis protein methyltransferase CheR
VALAPDIVAGVSRRLAEHAGLELPAWVVEARTTARIAALGGEMTPDAYVELIATGRGAGELDELIEAVRVGESSLFRHRQQIAALTDVVVPALRARGRRTIRVWSAGCASGEEPYTLAAVLSRALPGCTVSIVATDVSADALAAAETATYPRHELEDVPDAWRDAFVVDGDVVRVQPEIARLVRFERANLLDGIAPRSCDVVWCRNVLIYFTADARRRVIDRLVGATVVGGYVFVGYSESLRETPELDARRAGEAVFYVRRAEPRERSDDAGRKTLAPVRLRPPTGPGERRTPALGIPAAAPARRPAEDVLELVGTPDAHDVIASITERLGRSGMSRLLIDLDGAEILADELAPVLRRARAAARAAGVEIALRATRTGAKRWLSRNGFEEDAP